MRCAAPLAPLVGREQLLGVKGIGPRTFQQAAGFLRVRGGPCVLDTTAVHPESYAAAEALVREACGAGKGAGKWQLGAGAFLLRVQANSGQAAGSRHACGGSEIEGC